MFTVNRSQLILFVLLFLMMVTPLSVLAVEAAPLVWHIETVDAALSVGAYTSIVLDASDRPHITYFDDYWKNLKYARWTGSDWVIEPVDTVGDVGYSTSLALDASDRPHISYFDWTNGDVKYAWWNGSSWSIEAVDSGVTQGTSLTLDSLGRPRISYIGTSGVLKFARWTGSEWAIETVDSGIAALWPSLTLDSSDSPHISYYDNTHQHLKYARWTGSDWALETVDESGIVGRYPSLALDATDQPHISYLDYTNGNLKYARWAGSAWILETVDAAMSVGAWSSLTLDSNNFPHIGYHDYYWDDLKYAWWNGTAWFIKNVDSFGWVGPYCALALDSDNHPHISYWDGDNLNLKYASDPDEFFSSVTFNQFDRNSDGFDDSVEVIMDADTTYSGPLNVTAFGVLTYDDGGTEFGQNWSRWEITGTIEEYGFMFLQLPEGAPEGVYSVDVILYDERGSVEDDASVAGLPLSPPDMRELTIQVEGLGTTDPAPGSWRRGGSIEVDVTAIPAQGHQLDHWVLDGENVGQESPFTVYMNGDHVLTAVFVEISPTVAVLESCNIGGGQIDTFELGDTVYVMGDNYAPSTTFDLYVVNDVAAWTEGLAIPERVPGTATTITANADGWIPPTSVWAVAMAPGHYDLVVDVNGNGQYEAEIDALDSSDIEVTAGWIVIPELPVFLMLLFFMAVTFFALLLHS